MNIRKLCTPGKIWSYDKLRRFNEFNKLYNTDEEFRRDCDALQRKRHPMVITPTR